MSYLNQLSFGFGKKMPLLLQTEATECGLACLGMVSAFHGYASDLATLRAKFPISLKGSTLADLVQIAGGMHLGSRALRLEMHHLKQLRLPCILHWNLNHFVVLKEVAAGHVVIVDPAFGERRVALADAAKCFTGVALELWPNPGFRRGQEKQSLSLSMVLGHISGLKRSMGQVLLLAVALEVFILVTPFFMQWIVDNVLVSANRDLLTTLALGFCVMMLFQHTVATARSWVLLYMGTTLNIQWRANIFAHLLRLPVQYFEKRHVGDVVSRMGSVDRVQQTLTTSFIEALLDGAMGLIVVMLMFVYSPTLASISVGAMLLYALARWIWYSPLRNATEEHIIHAAKQESHFLETIRGVKTIKLFQKHDERRTVWLSLLIDQVNADLRTQKLQLMFKALNGVLFGLENILILWVGSGLVLDGNFSVGVLLAFIAYKTMFGLRVAALIDKSFEVRMLKLHGERIADIVLSENAPGEPLDSNTDALEPSIEVRNLRFRYAESEPYVLDGLSFKVEAGESVAIVGPSGCGKSTLLNVLLGILPPTEGEILIGGINVKRVGIERMRAAIGTVLQDDVLFAGSIANNISFFDESPDRARIVECAAMAAVAPEIEAMPMSYNTLVGDMGTVLSGGQKQRILLARALYKRPRILLLDEATSHLDIDREAQVNSAVAALNVTRIIIAHRPETIASAGRVIVLGTNAALGHVPAPARQAQLAPA